MSEICSPKEAATILGIAERLVRRYCVEGRISSAKKIGKQWIMDRSEVNQFAKIPRPVGNPNLTRSPKKRSLKK